MSDEITPVFGLTKSQLLPIVQGLGGAAGDAFEVVVSRQLPAEDWGGACEPVVLAFTFTTPAGEARAAEVFAKRYQHPGPREAKHYAWLSQLGAPVPNYYGRAAGPDEREVLFLECIDAPNQDRQVYLDPAACRSFFTTLARFNATRPPEGLRHLLPQQDWALRLGPTGAWNDRRGYWPAGRVLGRIRAHEQEAPRDDALGRFCTGPQEHLRAIALGAERLAGPIGHMETGPVHDDFRAAQTGWRRSPRELVVYDLEFLGLGPRFHDVATVLGEPDEEQTFCLPRPELARLYLQEYARAGGEAPPLAQFLAEVRLLHLAHRLSVLGWWLGYVYHAEGEPGQSEQQKAKMVAARRDELYAWLRFLLAGVTLSKGAVSP